MLVGYFGISRAGPETPQWGMIVFQCLYGIAALTLGSYGLWQEALQGDVSHG
jgi:hypothetical protein